MRKLQVAVTIILLCALLGASNVFGILSDHPNAPRVMTGEEAERYMEETFSIPHEIRVALPVVQAVPTSAKVMVDGEEVNFRAYNIRGNNFFMLRDIAHAVNGTPRQFEVAWNGEKRAINLLKNKQYTGEIVVIDTPHKEEVGTLTTSSIFKDGERVYMLGYVIEDRTYFMLRDLGEHFDIIVDWDDKNRIVVISTLSKSEYALNKEAEIAREIIRLVNIEREKEGVDPLRENPILNESAKFKSQDMSDNNYYAHDSPIHGSFGNLLRSFNVVYTSAGENLYMGISTAERAVQGWMDSPGHRRNILRPQYTDIGVGVAGYENGLMYFTQHFIGLTNFEWNLD